jgi:hypothetical protein
MAPGQTLEVALDQQVHRGRVHMTVGELSAAPVQPRPEEGTGGQAGLLEILTDTSLAKADWRCGQIQSDLLLVSRVLRGPESDLRENPAARDNPAHRIQNRSVKTSLFALPAEGCLRIACQSACF